MTESAKACNLFVGYAENNVSYGGQCHTSGANQTHGMCAPICQKIINDMLTACKNYSSIVNFTKNTYNSSQEIKELEPFNLVYQIRTLQDYGAPTTCQYGGENVYGNCPAACTNQTTDIWTEPQYLGACATWYPFYPTFVVQSWNSCSGTCFANFMKLQRKCQGCTPSTPVTEALAQAATQLMGQQCAGKLGTAAAPSNGMCGCLKPVSFKALVPGIPTSTPEHYRYDGTLSVALNEQCYVLKPTKGSGNTYPITVTRYSSMNCTTSFVGQKTTFTANYGVCQRVPAQALLSSDEQTAVGKWMATKYPKLNLSASKSFQQKKLVMTPADVADFGWSIAGWSLYWQVRPDSYSGALNLVYFDNNICSNQNFHDKVDPQKMLTPSQAKATAVAYLKGLLVISKGLHVNASLMGNVVALVNGSSTCTDNTSSVTGTGSTRSFKWSYEVPAPGSGGSVRLNRTMQKPSCGCNESYTLAMSHVQQVCCPFIGNTSIDQCQCTGPDCQSNPNSTSNTYFNTQCGFPASFVNGEDTTTGLDCNMAPDGSTPQLCSACQAAVFSAANVCPSAFLDDPTYVSIYSTLCGGDLNALMKAAHRPPVPGFQPNPPAAQTAAAMAVDTCGKSNTTVCVSTVLIVIGVVIVVLLLLVIFFMLLTRKQVKEGEGQKVSFVDTSSSIYDSSTRGY